MKEPGDWIVALLNLVQMFDLPDWFTQFNRPVGMAWACGCHEVVGESVPLRLHHKCALPCQKRFGKHIHPCYLRIGYFKRVPSTHNALAKLCCYVVQPLPYRCIFCSFIYPPSFQLFAHKLYNLRHWNFHTIRWFYHKLQMDNHDILLFFLQ